MQINITYDPSAANAPAGFKTAVEAAVKFFETTFTTSITVNITFGWGVVGGQPMDPGALGESGSTFLPFSYGAVNTALTGDAVTPYAQLAAHFLPAVDPTNGGVFELTSADAKALGLADPAGAGLDGSVGLSASANFTFDPSNGVAFQTYDAVGVLEHEISEVLGRQSLLGFTPPGGGPEFGLLDLFRYPAAGQLGPTSPTGSFSLDGQTLLTAFNNPSNGGDPGDWAAGNLDSFNAFGTAGQIEPISPTDLAVMEALGYHQALEAPLPVIPNVSPVSQEVLTQNTVVAQGQSLYFDSGQGFFMVGAISGTSPSLTNSGIITDIAAGSNAIVTSGGSFFTGSVITNTSSGAIYSEAITGDAYGYDSGSWGPNLLNQGLIQVVSLAGNALGVQTWDSAFQFTNASSATFKVWAHGNAVGVDMSGGNNGGSFTNAGDLEVTGASAVGVRGATSFDNSGTIKAISLDPSQPSIGVEVYEENAPSYANSGTISGDYSFLVDPFGVSPPSKPNIDLINTGTMLGAISLGAGVNQIHNTGSITGDITFGNGDSTYDGAGGHLTGAIHLGVATNTVTLGADNGIVFGGGGSDTIIGGAGNDFFEIARGDNSIDGGGGFNTLSFADSDTGVTVDLGAGTAVGAGSDTLKNIQEVIGSSFNDTLKAGAQGATLIAGSGVDTLIGGAGADTLVAGAGGDTMTGNGGADTFIYAAGDKQLVITDFKAGGDQDVLKVYGYASAESVTQKGADTLITLSGGDGILLKGVQASSLAPADIAYTARAYQPPPVPPGPPIFGSSPIDFTYDLTIYASEHLNLAGQPYGLLDDPFGFNLHSLDNFGSVTVTGAIGDLYGLQNQAGALGGAFTNEAGATFSISNSGGAADGIFGEAAPSLTNAGNFTVTASGVAIGVSVDTYSSLSTNTASGVIDITSTGASAFGFHGSNGASLVNDGQITVSAIAQATAFFSGFFESQSVINNGLIQATSTGGDKSWGLLVSGLELGPGRGVITNTGTIRAQTAILDQAGPFSPASAPSVAVTNSGSIYGDIDLGGGQASLSSTGIIVGDILLHDDDSGGSSGGDTIDLRGGSFTGFIAISPGANSGTASVNDVIYTDAGSTLIKVAGDEPKLTVAVNGAAGGQTTVQFDIASTQASETHNADGSWLVNAGPDGVFHLSDVQTLQFSDTIQHLALGQQSPLDFSGDGRSGVLFAQSDGTLGDWLMSGTGIAGGGAIGTPGGTWQVVGSGDFNGDGKTDIVFQDASGNVATWEMNGTQIVGGGAIGDPGGTWAVKGVGAFTGGAQADILFQDASGNVAIWDLSGTSIIGGGTIGNPQGAWAVKAVGDFYGTGTSDILFQDASHNVAIWEMNGTSIVGGGQIGNPGGTWQVEGVGDFNGDGKSDILFEDASGEYAVWEMNGTQIIGGGDIGNPGAMWAFAGIGDYNGDGHADILFTDAAGNLAIWEMNGTQIIGGGQIGNPGSIWHVLG